MTSERQPRYMHRTARRLRWAAVAFVVLMAALAVAVALTL